MAAFRRSVNHRLQTAGRGKTDDKLQTTNHRQPKLTIRGVILCVCVFFLLLCERSAKRDMEHI